MSPARVAARVLAGAALVAAACAAGAWLYLRASLPLLDGNVPAGTRQTATIARDAQGSVTIRAFDRLDAAYATGFAHAQDRYFQMDLLRRSAAGELAALVGAGAVPVDSRVRLHRFRHRAEHAYARLPGPHQALLQRYAEGVNAGLAALDARPFEYALLRTAPAPWQPTDTLLVIYAMYLDLQGGGVARALSRQALADLLPAPLVTLLTPARSRWEAPLDRAPSPATDTAGPEIAGPRPDWLDTPRPPRSRGVLPGELFVDAQTAAALGSNGWAVDARHGAQGRALVANDMHLGLRLPNVWYRLTLQWTTAEGPRRVSGVSLPGTPIVVAGSNGHVAWGFTNSYGHFLELVRLDIDPADPGRYRGPTGEWETAAQTIERIDVSGNTPVPLPVRETRWGPMLQAAGRTYAIRWIAHLDDAVNVALADMENARDIGQALSIGQAAGIPTQNLMVADRNGRIGWTLAGPLPRTPLDAGGFPVAPLQAGAPLARLSAADYPVVTDPAYGRLWSGNSTQLADPDAQRKIGDGGADVGARATQIRDALFAAGRFDERDMLSLQLDDRARWMEFLRTQALSVLDEAAIAGHPDRASFRRLLLAWDGRADASSTGYALLRAYYDALYDAWFGPLDERLAAIESGLSVRRASTRLLAVMEDLVRARAWQPAYAADWNAFMLERIDTAIAGLAEGKRPLDEVRWGDRNRLAIAHPLARVLPAAVARWLAAPRQPMPGDIHMPRVQGASFGASERFVVSPGHEDQGILEMPGGASGHPLSPFFLAGHRAWVEGQASPFLPGPDAHRLTLSPPGAGG
ncbi:MAG: penicillin acylase family protein [Pigmentiphaga sp.]|uniref:penicillin acylase family protein n=1 Tax=Pigmentiphaga sp. TaxID=1977564 RepID=UPI0029A8F7D5|nr:penicillin acylase family protein [Pigmentiphaga sp.]MDX3907199.1 penicillin acylase family protein [Pigmentiphaga sp.]